MPDIVTRPRVSKRDLYGLFDNKHAVLTACISERAQQMRRPLDPTTPMPQTPDALAVESDRAPEIARTLDSNGRESNQKALPNCSEKLSHWG